MWFWGFTFDPEIALEGIMELQCKSFSLSEIRELDLVAYLETLGFPVAERRKNDTDYWYLSPLGSERTPSFHVNRLTNEWYDFPLAIGGNPVDFCLRFFTCSIPELLARFNGDIVAQQLPVFDPSLHEGRVDERSKLVVKEVRNLYRYALKNYLHERMIPVSVAEVFCKELDYEVNGRTYYGIGFQNNTGGWEIRNKNYKQSCAPKEITCLGSGAESVHVFEGFMDFLSWQTMNPYVDPRTVDFVVLNGAGLFDRALPFLEQHSRAHLWLDRDITGMAYAQYALAKGAQFVDESGLYAKFKDLNDWLLHKGEAQKRVLKPPLRIVATG
jgi:hypothetical protein